MNTISQLIQEKNKLTLKVSKLTKRYETLSDKTKVAQAQGNEQKINELNAEASALSKMIKELSVHVGEINTEIESQSELRPIDELAVLTALECIASAWEERFEEFSDDELANHLDQVGEIIDGETDFNGFAESTNLYRTPRSRN